MSLAVEFERSVGTIAPEIRDFEIPRLLDDSGLDQNQELVLDTSNVTFGISTPELHKKSTFGVCDGSTATSIKKEDQISQILKLFTIKEESSQKCLAKLFRELPLLNPESPRRQEIQHLANAFSLFKIMFNNLPCVKVWVEEITMEVNSDEEQSNFEYMLILVVLLVCHQPRLASNCNNRHDDVEADPKKNPFCYDDLLRVKSSLEKILKTQNCPYQWFLNLFSDVMETESLEEYQGLRNSAEHRHIVALLDVLESELAN